MFGLFRGTDRSYEELLEYLTGEWHMKESFARAFLDAYKSSIGGTHKRAKAAFEAMIKNDPAGELLRVARGGTDHAMALVFQAYHGYMGDLRTGTHVDTDVELAIWAILANRSDLVEELDGAFGTYIEENHGKKFPQLFEFVFERS